MSLWLAAAACAQFAAVSAQAPSKYNFPEFTGGYQAAGRAVNSLASQSGGYSGAPASGPAPYNAAAVAAGYNYPEFTGGYPARRPTPGAGYNPAPAPGGYNQAAPAYSPAPYNPAPAASYNQNPAGGYNGYNNYNDGYSSASSGPSPYDYNYASDTSAKQEVRSPDGTVRGAYSYIDANGQTQRVQYVSDSSGFHVVSGTNLPQAPAPAPAQ